jgi:hypothetical protein
MPVIALHHPQHVQQCLARTFRVQHGGEKRILPELTSNAQRPSPVAQALHSRSRRQASASQQAKQEADRDTDGYDTTSTAIAHNLPAPLAAPSRSGIPDRMVSASRDQEPSAPAHAFESLPADDSSGRPARWIMRPKWLMLVRRTVGSTKRSPTK